MLDTQLSLFCQVLITVGIILSVTFCLTIVIAIRYSKNNNNNINKQHKLLFWITSISTISCLITFIFVLDWTKLGLISNRQYEIQSVIVEIIYLSQSFIPCLTISQSINLFEITSNKPPKLGRIPTTDSDTFTQLPENKNSKIYIIYLVFTVISLCFIVISNITQIHLIRYILIFLPYILLESYFIIAGLKIYYNSHFYELSLPVIAYILIRPIIVCYTIPVIINHNSANYFSSYMSFSIITISVLAIVTIVLPSICVQNERKSAMYDVPLECAIDNNTTTTFQQLHSHTFTKDDIHQMKIIIQNYDLSAEETDEKIDDPKHKEAGNFYVKVDTYARNDLQRTSTSYDHNPMRRGITDTFNNMSHLSIFSKPSNAGAGASITLPDLNKKATNAKSKTYTSTRESTTTQANESTKNSHFYAEDTNEILGSTQIVNEIIKNVI